MNNYEKYLHFDIDTVMSDYEYSIDGSYIDIFKELMKAYDDVSMEEWFEDKTIVDKQIPEFNFV